ncbi:MAG: helix-turn-helix domain-containing protein [Candidatus Anammoxibacter sp.]
MSDFVAATLGLRNPLHTSIKYIVCAARPFTYPDGYPANPKTIGEHMRKKRMDNRLMQSEVANIIGVSEESIWSWENGRTKPSKKNLKIINNFVSAYYP